MKRTTGSRRRQAVHVTLARAARLHRLVGALAQGGRTRDELLAGLGLGLRTFYRELELLRRVGVRVRLVQKHYVLTGTPEEAEGRLPFPDPELSFAEMGELAKYPGPAAQRLAAMLEQVTREPVPLKPRRAKPRAR
jgi:hypothetical protein